MEVTLVDETNGLEIWIPAVVSIITLVINLLYYSFVQSRVTYKTTSRESLKNISVELLNYLAEITSFETFDGVPTRIRKYSLQIHLLFKGGTASKELETLLENIFRETQKRKGLVEKTEIEDWNANLRVQARELRKQLAKHCGAL